MDKSKYEVHKNHCCVKHGCKYGNPDCPVVNKIITQKYTCEYCSFDGIKSVDQLKDNINMYIYPAIIKFIDNHYEISFPDINNCFTFGEDIEDVIKSGEDILSLFIQDMKEDNIKIPAPSSIDNIKLEENESLIIIKIKI